MSSVDMCEHDWPGTGCKECKREVHEAENAKLRAELERRAVLDGWKLVPVEPTEEMVAAMHEVIEKPYNHANKRQMYQAKHTYKAMLAAAPSAPKADDPVKQMLLEALEKMLTPAVLPLSGNTLSMSPVKMVAHIEAAIAAARKGK